MMESPLRRIEHALQFWVSFVIMPVFAFSNAGVHVIGTTRAAVRHPVTFGVALGLVLGKPLGISTFDCLAEKVRLAARTPNVKWSQIRRRKLCLWHRLHHILVYCFAGPSGGRVRWIWRKIGTITASLVAGTFFC